MDDRRNGPGMRLRRLARAGALAALGLALPLLARAGCRVETLELPVRMVGSRAVATVGINGTPVPLTVDSGAFFSTLTEAAAAQLGLHLNRNTGLRVQGLTGPVEAYTTRVDKLQLFKGEVPRVEFVVGGNEPGAGTMGLMGRNLLSFTDTEYDLSHGMIRFHFPNDDCGRSNMAYWAGSSPVTEVDLRPDFRAGKVPALRAEVKLNGNELVALFDTGAATIVSQRSARRAGVAETALTPAGSMYGAGRGSTRLWTAPFEKFEIGDESIAPLHLRVAELNLDSADMLLGIDFFLSHRLYVSKARSKMFITYNGGPVFALDKTETAASSAGVGADAAASGAPAANADDYARRGAASAARNDLEGALADLDRACELDPGSALYLSQRGAVQEALKRPVKALEDLDRALELDPALADARGRRAWLRFATKNRDGAKADLDLLDAALPAQAQLRLSMAELYLRLDQPAPALRQLNDWLPAHPREVRRDIALSQRCRLRLRLGVETNEALDDCNDALDADSKNPRYLDSRGWVHLRLGNDRRALSDFDRGLEQAPGGAYSLYGRGLAKTHLGDASGGELDLAAARRLLPDIDRRVVGAGLATAAAPKASPTGPEAASLPRSSSGVGQ